MRGNVDVEKEMELDKKLEIKRETKLEERENIVDGRPGDIRVHCVSHFNNFIEYILWIVIK